jgi:nitrite reductase/ring-hydroxylating ferredoxin subunit
MVRLLPVNRCRADAGTFVAHDGFELAVFLLTETQRVVVVDNTCPHSGGNLSGGEVQDSVVTCPWHQWKFDLNTGVCTDSARARVRTYPAEIRDGFVWAELPVVPQGDRSDSCSRFA